MFRQEKVNKILRGNFYIAKEEDLSQKELDFLSYFFDIYSEEEINEETLKIQKYLVLEKKPKFIYH